MLKFIFLITMFFSLSIGTLSAQQISKEPFTYGYLRYDRERIVRYLDVNVRNWASKKALSRKKYSAFFEKYGIIIQLIANGEIKGINNDHQTMSYPSQYAPRLNDKYNSTGIVIGYIIYALEHIPAGSDIKSN